MKRFLLAVSFLVLGACSKVPAGYVGVKVYLLGGAKGVDHEVVGVGRYWLGMNEDLYLFPTFEQNPKYSTGDDDAGAPISFQTREGMAIEADFSVTYNIDPTNVAAVFQRYRLGVDEINSGPLRNLLRDAANEVSSTLDTEAAYGTGKVAMIDKIQSLLATRAKGSGINVTQVSLLGAMRLPPTVVASINAKLQATQEAQQRENELRTAEAQAKKEVATADGEAQKLRILASGRAVAVLTEAEAQAKANRVLSQSLTSELIEYEKAKKWNGALPQVSGSSVPMINLK